MNTQLHRARYVQDAIATASPARLLTMLYDRLVRDIAGAELAITSGDNAEANGLLLHAQDIVVELQSSLDVTIWEGGRGLQELYRYLYSELIKANIHKDKTKVGVCLRIVEPLRDAWHEAALLAAGSMPAGSIARVG
jgi:flagellar secretion chaperone FliS